MRQAMLTISRWNLKIKLLRRQGPLVLVIFILLGSCSQENSLPDSTETNPLFTLISPEFSGVDFKNLIVETAEQNHLVNDMLIAGAGVAVGDINNDGFPDLYFTGNQVQDRLFLNKGGLKFEDITVEAKILQESIWSTGVTMADVNNDGYLDIYVSKYVHGNLQLSENFLYINNGDLTFTESARQFGLADSGFSIQANFIDVNMDGHLDAFVVNQPTSDGKRQGQNTVIPRNERGLYTDKLYMNNGNNQFVERSDQAGLTSLAFGLSATAGDLNNDNYPDLYVSNDYEIPDFLYFNQKDGSFKNKANSNLKHMSSFSMGSDIADFDNDGFLDIVVVDMVAEDHVRAKTNMGGMSPKVFWNIVNRGYHYQYMYNTLQRNNGDGSFSEIAQLAGVSSTDWSWSALFSDFDNDGNKDLFITNGVKRAMRNSDLNNTFFGMMDSLRYVAAKEGKTLDEVMDIMDFVNMAPVEKLQNYVYKNNGDFTFTKKSDDWGLSEETLSYGAAYADLDLDGDVDLIINNADEFAYIYRNNAREQNIGNYLNVKVLNEHGAPFYGAKVKIYQEDKFWQLVELTNVRGYKSKSEDIVHFGIGGEKSIDKLEVIYPTGKVQEFLNVSANQQITVSVENASKKVIEEATDARQFYSVTNKMKINHLHQENEYDDYGKEILLPHKMSNFGPCISVGDVNQDGLEDFFVGGSSGFAGTFYLQQTDETFIEYPQPQFENDKVHEDMHSELFDYDGDGDLDLYVVSGGNEFEPESKWLIDRLYVNDGKASFTRSQNIIPENLVSGSVIKSADYDNDGDLDLFVGGRLIPGKYPFPASSFMLENREGKYHDVTQELAPFMEQFGLVTNATWTDLDGDDLLDLVVVGEWMPITILMNTKDGFNNITDSNGLTKSAGWYYSIISADFDSDGDMDLIAGNLGLNYKYKASLDHPFEVYSDDLDANGVNDIVLGYYEHGEIFPVRGKSCSSQQIPSLGEKIETFNEFANANIFDLYGASLENAIHYEAYNFATVYVENIGNNEFKIKPLVNDAQFSSVNSIISKDFNGDGILDIVISGNLYPAEIETPRNDAGMGLYLTGDGKGNFSPLHISESGFLAPNDAKDMKLINIGSNGKQTILVGNNQSYLQAIGFEIRNDKKTISMMK
jgi:hypothetical protein